MKNNSPIDLKNQLLSVISQMQSVSHLFVETGKDFSRKRKNFFEYYGAAEPPVRCGESHLSGLTEPPHFVY